MKKLFPFLASILLAITLLLGCGGQSGFAGSKTGASLAVKVAWPKPSGRLIPVDAKSIKVVVSLNGTPVASVVIPRPPAGQTSTSTTINSLPVGTVLLTAFASPNADGSGIAQASGTTQVTLQAGATVGTSLTMESTINAVVISPAPLTLIQSQPTLLTATAYDKANEMVLTGPTTWTWTSSGTGLTLMPAGNTCTVTAAAGGSGTITVTETESQALETLATSVTSTVSYTSFQGANLTLEPWAGQHIAFQTADPGLDPAVMSKLTTTFDSVYTYYQGVTGQTPALYKNLNGLDTISEVSDTCGGGCSVLGLTGMEIQPFYFQLLYSQVRDSNQYDQVLFYEFGRNFWFYGPKIEYVGSDNLGTITTGYAVLMRFESMDALGVQGAPFHGSTIVPFDTLTSDVENLIDLYEADPTLNWSNTLEIGKAPDNPLGLGGTDLFASMCLRLARDHGGQAFIGKLWKAVAAQPDATTTQEALTNFVNAASSAAGTDLTSQFRDTWKWPI